MVLCFNAKNRIMRYNYEILFHYVHETSLEKSIIRSKGEIVDVWRGRVKDRICKCDPGISDPGCLANQVWKGCANSCSDVTECNQDSKNCTGEEELEPLCICQGGYSMSDGECVLTADCPLPANTFTNWNAWTACSKSCDSGTKSRNRVCLAAACTGKCFHLS